MPALYAFTKTLVTLNDVKQDDQQMNEYSNKYSTLSILLNIMFYAPMGRFQLDLIYYFTYFSTVVPSKICVFLSCRPFVVNTTITIISDLNSNCQKPKPGDRSNFNTHKICWNCRTNDDRSTGKKHTNVGWDDGGKIGK